jgi:methionyl-tRNA formyltransferase
VRTAYLGTSDFAATVLRRLAGSPHRPALVVTPPDRRQGRGRKVSPPPVALAADELGLELLQAENVNEEAARERIAAARPEALLVCAFGQLIREPLLSDYEILNVHPSLLPRWRGAAPIERAIMAGDERTGVCVMRLTAGLDSGPVATCEEVEIGSEEDFAELAARLAAVGGDLLVRALDLAAGGDLAFAEQPEEGVTYAEKIAPAERRLDPGRPAAELAAKVRALAPHVGVYLETAGGERLGVKRARAVPHPPAAPAAPPPQITTPAAEGGGPAPGEVAVDDGEILLGTGDGTLRLDEVQPPGGRAMAAADYLRGHEPPRLAPVGSPS